MVSNLYRKDLLKLKQYTPSLTLEEISREVGIPVDKIIKADSGENLYSEKYQNKKVLQKVKLYLYPDPYCRKLRKKLADYTGLEKERIMCGNGSDELIDLLIRLFISPNDELIINPPTFPMYEFYGQLSGAKIQKVLRKENLNVDIAGVFEKINLKTKLIFIDSPGNPSSVVISKENIKKLLAKNIIIVVDEAYYEYCNQTVIPLIKQYPNLIVLRSLSKWSGLAGLRSGYLIANPEIIKTLLTIKPPYNVNSLSQEMACSVLDKKEKFLIELQNLLNYRKILVSRLTFLTELKVYPSEGAYVLFQPNSPARLLQEFLRKNGILVKYIDQPRLNNCIRINLLRQKEINKLIFLLRRFYEKN